jgi:hypothetical protein
VGEAYHQDDGHVGLDESGQPRDASGGCGPELTDEEAGALGDPEHGDRSADLVVVRVDGCDGLALVLEDPGEEVLRGGLAVGPRDPDDAEVTALPDTANDLAGEVSQGGDGIRDDDLTHRFVDDVLHDRERGTRLGSGADEAVPVGLGARLRDEDRPGSHDAGIGVDDPGDDCIGRI